jgi:hypothetical protein
MTTAYPAALDQFSNPSGTDPNNSAAVRHSTQHANANDAIEALQAKVGIDDSAVATSIDKRLADVETVADDATADLISHSAAPDPHPAYMLADQHAAQHTALGFVITDARDQGSVIYAAAGRTGLTFSGGANTPTLADSADGLQVTTPVGAYAEVTLPQFATPRLISEQWYLEVWCSDWSAVSSMAMYLGSVSNFATSWTRTFNANNSDKTGETAMVGTGTRRLHSDFASHATLGSPDKATTMLQYHKLRITPMAGRQATVSIKKVVFDILDSPSISITFDDGYQTIIDNALPVLVARGLRGSACIIPGKIGTSSRFASVASWLNWIAAGNECIGHGPNFSEDNLTDAGTIAGAVADMNFGRNFLVQNGLAVNGSENVYCWPQGIYTFAGDKRDPGLRDAVRAAGYVGSRGTEFSYFNSLLAGEYPKCLATPIFGWVKSVPDEPGNITTLLAKIDEICDTKKSGTLMFHDVEASPDNGNNITLANFTTLMDRIALRVAQGRCINPLYSQQIKWA